MILNYEVFEEIGKTRDIFSPVRFPSLKNMTATTKASEAN